MLDPNGSLEGSATLEVKMPSQPGEYRLLVTFDFGNGNTVQKDWPIRVVEPYVFQATVVNDGATPLEGVLVTFLVDGVVIGTETVDVGAMSSVEVTHRWATPPLSQGQHRLEIQLDADSHFVNLYGGEKSHYSYFHVGQKSYSTITWAMGIALVILAIALIWVYRKPVRNRGRPRGRR